MTTSVMLHCPRCLFPHRESAERCANCREPMTADAKRDLSPLGIENTGRPFPTEELCGPQMRVLDVAAQIKASAYWHMVRLLAEKTIEAHPHQPEAWGDFIGAFLDDLNKKDWDPKWGQRADYLEPARHIDVAMSPATVLEWTASQHAYTEYPVDRLVARAKEGPSELFSFLAQAAFTRDVGREITRIKDDLAAATSEEVPGYG